MKNNFRGRAIAAASQSQTLRLTCALFASVLITGCDGGEVPPASSAALSSAQAVSSVAPTPSSVVSVSSQVAVSSAPVASSSVAPQSSSSAAASVASIPAGSTLVYAINAGGSAVTVAGVEYKADRFSTGGEANSTTNAIAGTTADSLYQSERYGTYKYEIPVTNSTYSVKMHFAELYQTAADSRYFSVVVEGQQIFTDKDLFDEVGAFTAYDVVVPTVMVADQKLTIELSSSLENPTISAFAIYSNAGGKYVEPPPPPVVTGDGKFPKFFVGNITTSGNIRSDFLQFWNQLTPENEGKWSSLEGTRNQFNWSKMDQYYKYANDNNILLKQHTFVWGAQSPGWITDPNLPGSEAKKEIEEYITTFCQRYPNVKIIDVVNEATPGHQPAAYAQRAYGNDWVKEVFRYARSACPNRVLVLNDYNVLSWNTTEFINMARSAAQSGFVDAIGFQAHGLEHMSGSQLKQKMDQIDSALKLPFYVTEYDVASTNDQTQLNLIKDQFPVFYKDPRVKGITIWGYVVGKTWVNGTGLIQDNGSFRPAMTWLMDYIKNNPK